MQDCATQNMQKFRFCQNCTFNERSNDFIVHMKKGTYRNA